MAQVFGISYFGWTFGRLVAEKYQHWPARIDVTHQLFVFFLCFGGSTAALGIRDHVFEVMRCNVTSFGVMSCYVLYE